MKVIIKPAGAAMLLAAAGALAYITFGRNARPAPEKAPPVAAKDVTLQNADFEGAFKPVPDPYNGQKAAVTGRIADGWQDNSGWADLSVKYLPEAEQTVDGTSCQKIMVKDLRHGQVQFVQPLLLEKGKSFTASISARSSAPIEIELALRKAGEPYTLYKATTAKIGADWKRVTVTGTIRGDGESFLLFAIRNPATVWIDAVRIEESPSVSNDTPPSPDR